MYIQNNLENRTEKATTRFDVMEALEALSPNGKILLQDCLISGSGRSFSNVSQILWPRATKSDIKRLGEFLQRSTTAGLTN